VAEHGEPEHRRARVTSADVAREAGVSRATVSYVLNDSPAHTIPEVTRRRVLDAVARLGYAPSAAARTLRRGRSDLVLFVTPDWPVGHTYGQIVESLTADLAVHGLTLVMHQRTPQPWSALLRALSPAAVIGVQAFDADEETQMRAAQVPLVTVTLDETERRAYALTQSQRAVGRCQVEHLVARGYRRLGYAWLTDPRVRTFDDLRLDGVRQECARLGLKPPVVQDVPIDGTPSADAVRAWLAEEVTGVCAINDEAAFAVLHGMRTLGLSAPEDLAVIGVDDIPVAQFASPPLTTVAPKMSIITRFLATSVLRAMRGEPLTRPPRADLHELVVRESA
jgi:DNA-binding LacI/PurR family transcriptional regulator